MRICQSITIRKIYFLIFLIQLSCFCFAQPGEWTWIKGSNSFNSAGNFGTKGVPSPSNEPPALYEACEWTDLNGNFWFYGGLENITGSKTHNDLWRYNPATNEWTWMTGTHSLNDLGNFGVQGVPSPTNYPPGLGYGAATWVDQGGDLWMFGGWCDSTYSDLWKYDIGANIWTWMKGPGTGNPIGVYGVRTVPNIANNPGARSECAATWTANNGDLWLFGGYIGQIFNDMWRYNIGTNTWTWMKGSDSTNQQGRWGAQGIEDSSNVPSARWVYTRWKDNAGNFWVFGGNGYDSTGGVWQLGDLWRFNPITNNWTWMSGSNLGTASAGNYGAKCVSSSSNRPPHRVEDRAVWTDTHGDFWMFGGFYRTSPFNFFSLNDLWKYCVSSNIWTWVSGDSIPNSAGNWGTQGVSSPTNKPSERNGAIGWSDSNGHLYLFGGTDGAWGNFYNDLWKFTIDSACAPCAQSGLMPLPNFTINDSVFCKGSCVNFINLSQNATSYQWSFPGGTPSSDTAANPQNICYFTQGNYSVTLTATNNVGSNSMTSNNIVTVYPPVQFSPITQHGDTLFSIPGYVNYQWYQDTTMINGANNYYYVATQSGDYSVHVIDSNGCTAAAQLINVIAFVKNIQDAFNDFTVIYLNGRFILNINSTASALNQITVTNQLGEIIYHKNIIIGLGKSTFEFSRLDISAGIYFVKIINLNQTMTRKVLVK